MDAEVNVNTNEVEDGLSLFETKFAAALDMYASTAAKKLESEAKLNRPWTDRTSRARQGLTGSHEAAPTEITIVLAHTVDYGLWLELAHEKKYAIIDPTITVNKDEIIQGLQGLMDRIKVR